MISRIFILLARALSVMEGVVLIYCVMTWFVPRTSRLMSLLSGLVEPLLWPLRRWMMRFTGAFGMDFSPFILMILMQVIRSILIRLAFIG